MMEHKSVSDVKVFLFHLSIHDEKKEEEEQKISKDRITSKNFNYHSEINSFVFQVKQHIY